LTTLRDAFVAIKPDAAVSMTYSSPGAMAVAGRTLIAADARTLSIAALVLVLAILAWVYRSVPVVLLCFIPAACGLRAGGARGNAGGAGRASLLHAGGRRFAGGRDRGERVVRKRPWHRAGVRRDAAWGSG